MFEAWFFVAAFVAGVIGTVAGFGAATILLPIAVLFFDFPTALVLVAFMHVFGNVTQIALFRVWPNKQVLLYFGVASVILTLVGALLVSLLDQSVLRGLLGLFLIGYSTFRLVSRRPARKKSNSSMIVGGAASGFVAGLIGTGGALRAMFLSAFGLTKERYIVTSATIALAVDSTRIPVYIIEGFLPAKYYLWLPGMLLLAAISSYVGKRILKIIPPQHFTYVVLTFLLIVGLKFVFDWLVSYF